MGHPPAGLSDTGHHAFPVRDAEAARLAAERLGERVAVEPALARDPEGAKRNPIQVQPWKAPGEFGGRKQADISALPGLERMVVAQRGRACLGGDVEVAALGQADVGPLTVDRQNLPDAAQKPDAEHRHADVDGGRVLLPDRARRERARRARIGQVAVEHQDAAPKGRVGRQVTCRRTAHHGAARDHHVELLGHPGSAPALLAAVALRAATVSFRAQPNTSRSTQEQPT